MLRATREYQEQKVIRAPMVFPGCSDRRGNRDQRERQEAQEREDRLGDQANGANRALKASLALKESWAPQDRPDLTDTPGPLDPQPQVCIWSGRRERRASRDPPGAATVTSTPPETAPPLATTGFTTAPAKSPLSLW